MTEKMTEKILNDVKEFAPKLLFAILILVIGVVIIRLFLQFLKKALVKTKLDPLGHKFILSLLRVVLYVILIMTALSMLSVPMTSIVALISVVGLAVSLAIQDSLANLAGGLVLLLSKPFQVGDYVEIEKIGGTVKSISILQTKLITFDNKVILIPNGQVSSAKIMNFSAQDTRRLDLTFSISYSDDFEVAKKIISNIVERNPLALNDPPPVIRVSELAESSVNITCKVWTKTADFWDLNYDLLEQVKKSFDNEKISIPFPQMDVHTVN